MFGSRFARAMAGKALLIALVFAVPAGAARPPLAFTTAPGDAWTFRKTIDVEVFDGRCDEVALTSPVSTVMSRPQRGHARARLALGPGDNRIEVRCRKGGVAEAAPIWQHWRVRLPDEPKARITSLVGRGDIVLDGAASERAPARGTAIVHYHWRAAAANPAPLSGLPAEGPRIRLQSPAIDGEYRVTLQIVDTRGRTDESTVLFRVHGGKPEAIDLAHEHAAWIDDAVVYGVVPNLFGRRGLADVTAQLDRLAALGVNTLWLSPITGAPNGDFGYAVTDYFRVRPSLGTADDLRELIGAAHARGMHVILDLVVNHLSDRHPYAVDAAAQGRRSPYFDFLSRTASGAVVHYFNWHNLDNLNYSNAEVERMIVDASAYWVREFHVDGFRVDAAWGPRARAPDFWPRWRAELKRIDPDLLLIAEASARDPYYLEHGFDAAYDWTAELGQWSWHDAFDDPTQTVRRLQAAIDAVPGSGVLRFLDNNDTGKRFIVRYGAARTRVAAAMLLTLPGLPALYTGDEVGAAYEPYRDTEPISWSDAHGVENWYRRLIALRHREPALRTGAVRLVPLASAPDVLAYWRTSPDGAGKLLVLLNYGAEPARAVLALPPRDANAGAVDLLDGETIAADAMRSGIAISGYGVRILKFR